MWSFEGLDNDTKEATSLKAKAVVAAHDKDINCLAVAPFDSFVCSGSQVCLLLICCNFFFFTKFDKLIVSRLANSHVNLE